MAKTCQCPSTKGSYKYRGKRRRRRRRSGVSKRRRRCASKTKPIRVKAHYRKLKSGKRIRVKSFCRK